MSKSSGLSKLRTVVLEFAPKHGYDGSYFYQKILSEVQDPKTRKMAGVVRNGDQWLCDVDMLVDFVRKKIKPGRWYEIEKIPEGMTLEEFLEVEGTFSVSQFVSFFGKGSGFLEVTYSQLIPTTDAIAKKRVSEGIVRINDNWAIQMPLFKKHLEKYLSVWEFKKSQASQD